MPSLEELMNAARNVQEQMARAQAELDNIEVEGASGGGLVTVRATARGAVRGLTIDPSLLTAESKEMLEDLVVAAFNDAKTKVDAQMAEEMAQVTGGLQLPPGMKLPF